MALAQPKQASRQTDLEQAGSHQHHSLCNPDLDVGSPDLQAIQ